MDTTTRTADEFGYVHGAVTDDGTREPATDRPFTIKAVAKVRGDDWLFGAQACVDDYCSPVSSAVPGGAFEPVGKE